jgi:ABC-type cobalamin/Fe3+-siderophores transport system ATPase subunit
MATKPLEIFVQITAHSLKPARLKADLEPYLLLTVNSWNDYTYVTTFDVWYAHQSTWVRFGELKIAVDAEIQKVSYLVLDMSVEIEPKTYRFALNELFISLGQSRAYYDQFVAQISDPQTRNDVLARLHDVIWLEIRDPARPDLELRKAEVFSKSLLREQSAITAYGEGKFVLFAEELAENRFNFRVETQLKSRTKPLVLDLQFDRGDSLFPTNLTVIVGRNGLGKTQTLYAIQRMLCPPLNVPPAAGVARAPQFRCVISVSYSPFEHFPTVNMPAGENRPRYTYCGFHNNHGQWQQDEAEDSIGRAFTKMLELEKTEMKNARPRLAMFVRALKEGLDTNRIQLRDYNGATEPVDFLSQILRNSQQLEHWTADSPIETKHLLFDNTPYAELSAGQKMFVLVAANICATIEPGSLVLIDEPELCLHPNLECAYVTMIRTILELFESYAVVATHSVFVAREIPERCVWVLKEADDGDVIATRAQINTYGGDLNLIADYVFNNVASRKSFESELDRLADETPDFTAICEKYGSRLGFDALSYLRQKLETRRRNA